MSEGGESGEISMSGAVRAILSTGNSFSFRICCNFSIRYLRRHFGELVKGLNRAGYFT